MSDIKFCPDCQKEVPSSTQTCPDCGYQFVLEKKVQVSNAVNKNDRFDPVPLFLWSVIGFILPPVGVVLYFVFRKNWSQRAESAKDGFVLGALAWAIVILFLFFFTIDFRKLWPNN